MSFIGLIPGEGNSQGVHTLVILNLSIVLSGTHLTQRVLIWLKYAPNSLWTDVTKSDNINWKLRTVGHAMSDFNKLFVILSVVQLSKFSLYHKLVYALITDIHWSKNTIKETKKFFVICIHVSIEKSKNLAILNKKIENSFPRPKQQCVPPKIKINYLGCREPIKVRKHWPIQRTFTFSKILWWGSYFEHKQVSIRRNSLTVCTSCEWPDH